MDVINRSLAIVTPKQPFLDWTKRDDEDDLADGVFEELHEDPHTFLLPDYEDEQEQHRVLMHFWPMIFESMLDGWLRDPSGWPVNRDFAMFEAWFDVRTCSIVEDLYSDEPIRHE